MFWTRANIIFYGSCTIATIFISIGLYSIIGLEDQDSAWIYLMKYDEDPKTSATIRVYKPDDGKIRYQKKCNDSYELIRKQLKPYEKPDGSYLLDLGKCNEDFRLTNNNNKSMWGTVDRQPCVFLQLNTSVDTKRNITFYDSTNIPSNMPQKLKDYIGAHPEKKNVVWLSCDGEHEHNRKNMDGEIMYYPQPGFTYDRDCKNGSCPSKDQLPLVALKFEKIRTHVGVYILCKTWAKGLDEEKLRFQVYVD